MLFILIELERMAGADWVKPKEGPTPEFFRAKESDFEKRPVPLAKLAPYKVEVKVINVVGRGLCAYGHMPGDTFIFEGDHMEVVKSKTWNNDICVGALSAVLNVVPRYMWGGYLPDARGDEDNKVGLTICSDVKSLVVFQLRRIKNPESPYFRSTKYRK